MSLAETTKKVQRMVGAKTDGIYGPDTARRVLVALTEAQGVQEPAEANLPPEFDERSERNLSTLTQGAQKVLRPFARRAIAIGATMGVEVKVICGKRDRKAQEQAKRSGASRAGYGYSWHNFGEAIDFGCFRGGSYLDSDEPRTASQVYRAIASVAGEYGVIAGANWTSFVDEPHFQVDHGRTTPNTGDRNRLFAGTWRV